MMKIGFDPWKNARNIEDRGLPFDGAALLDWESAIVRRDRRKDYSEIRYQALVEDVDGKPYVVVFTRRGDTMWVISFRRAHDKERTSYGEKARSLQDR